MNSRSSDIYSGIFVPDLQLYPKLHQNENKAGNHL